MKREDTRGLSTVVATLLIILLVIVAVAIVWGVIRTIIVNNSEQISLGKFTIDLKIVSIRQTPQDVNIKVKRNAGEGELEGIVFSIFDGERTHIYEKHNVSLDPLEMKTFVVDYQGNIVSVSIYPIILSDSGKTLTGSVSDTYYTTGSSGGFISENCTIDCAGKECGDNGCGGSCGGCTGSQPYCVQGSCSTQEGGTGNCSCSANTCVGATCDNGVGGSCAGELEPDCTNELGYPIMCGLSENSCGTCGTCDNGWHCYEQSCQPDCTPDCTGKECGDNGCGGSCGYCALVYNSSYNCNLAGTCEMCTPNCGTKECGIVPNGCGDPFIGCGNCTLLHNSSYNCNSEGTCEICQSDCEATGRECGPVPNSCGESCGNCTLLYGYPEGSCSSAGICVAPEEMLNEGIIYSIWPIDIGIYFDSTDLPTSGVDYFGYYAKFPGSAEQACLRVWDFVTPVFPPYNMSYIRLAATSTEIKAGDNYEIWETYEGCCEGYFCEGL